MDDATCSNRPPPPAHADWGWGPNSYAGTAARIGPPIDSHSLGLITGRAYEAPGVWTFFVALAGVVLLPSVLLLGAAVVGGASDHARSAQVAWAIVLAVMVVIPLALLARTGTTVTDRGLHFTTMFGSLDLTWWEIVGFVGSGNGRPGLWAVRAGTLARSGQLPSPMHAIAPSDAERLAARLNAQFGRPPIGSPAIGTDGMAQTSRDPMTTWAMWTWLVPLVSLSVLSPVVLIVGASVCHRRWLWLVALGSVDLWILMMVGILSNTLAGNITAIITFLLGWVGASVLVLCIWLRGRSTVRARPSRWNPGSS